MRGRFVVHLRAPAGTQPGRDRAASSPPSSERFARRCRQRRSVARESSTTSASRRAAYSNLAFERQSRPSASADGEIHVALTPTQERVLLDGRSCVTMLPPPSVECDYPDVVFFFQAADIVGQILNFGLPAPIDVQVDGQQSRRRTSRSHQQLRSDRVIKKDAWCAVDVLRPSGRRARRSCSCRSTGCVPRQLGAHGARGREQPPRLVERRAVRPRPTSGSIPQNGVQLRASTVHDAAISRMTSLDGISARTPMRRDQRQLRRSVRSNLANMVERRSPHGHRGDQSLQRAAGLRRLRECTQHRDLGGVASGRRAHRSPTSRPSLPKGSDDRRPRPGREHERSSFRRIGSMASRSPSLLVYLLMVVNFQSWVDPLIIITRTARRARRHRVDALRHAAPRFQRARR